MNRHKRNQYLALAPLRERYGAQDVIRQDKSAPQDTENICKDEPFTPPIPHIHQQRRISKGKIVFPADMAHIQRENDFPFFYELAEKGKTVLPLDMAHICGR
jgi:hypothetical protein